MAGEFLDLLNSTQQDAVERREKLVDQLAI
jgi:hypothetical protein